MVVRLTSRTVQILCEFGQARGPPVQQRGRLTPLGRFDTPVHGRAQRLRKGL
jgi:hypothetical protein